MKEHKTVVRWVIVKEDKEPFYPRQGRFSYETEGNAIDQIDLIQHENPSYDFSDLEAVPYLCHDVNHDPIKPYDEVADGFQAKIRKSLEVLGSPTKP